MRFAFVNADILSIDHIQTRACVCVGPGIIQTLTVNTILISIDGIYRVGSIPSRQVLV